MKLNKKSKSPKRAGQSRHFEGSMSANVENNTYFCLSMNGTVCLEFRNLHPSHIHIDQQNQRAEVQFSDCPTVLLTETTLVDAPLVTDAAAPAKKTAASGCLYPFVNQSDMEKIVVERICYYQEGKNSPKDRAMPVRAAMDAGVVRRPTHTEYDSVDSFANINKSSLSTYTNPETTPYSGKSYDSMVDDFRHLK